MTENFALRPATLLDFDAAYSLYKDLVGSTPVPDGDAGRQRFGEVLGHPGTTIWLGCLGSEPVAMTTLHILPNMTFGGRPYALVENVVTARDWQGQGFGRRVMEHVIAEAWAADAYKIMLLTGRALGARGFYERLGFTADEKHGMTLRRAPPRG